MATAPSPSRATPLETDDHGWATPPPPDGIELRPAAIPESPSGYRLIRPLGRGGMSVVYEAEQITLHRSVAIKFLETAAWATHGLTERFHAEAEAVAGLRHPNIVQIIERGEYGGRPYLVLEYVAGGTLAQRLAAGPLPPPVAAQLTATLARTVAFSHAQGVIHRDLKPANILLRPARGEQSTESDTPPSDSVLCSPSSVLISDFGLVKRLDRAAGLTETGAVVGTPSYMAPEQAEGHAEIGPAADIYALGAILYECLTGRPPFRAASSLETLEQVRTVEPVSPQHLQPGVPRDLETISLACLRKKPGDRYASADDLANDLERFLAGEPIHARPLTRLERTAKWVRRKPAAAALIAVIALAGIAGIAGGLIHQSQLNEALTRISAEKLRADEQYRQARVAFRQMLARLDERRYLDLPRAIELRNAQYEDALRFFAVIVAQQDDPDPEVQLDVARTKLEVAKLQRSLSRPAEADASLHAALRIFDDLMTRDPDRREFIAGRADCLATLGYWLSNDRKPDGGVLAEAAALFDRLLAADPQNIEYREARSGLYSTQGSIHLNRREYDASKECFHRHERLRAALAAEQPSAHNLVALAQARSSLGLAYQMTGPREKIAEYYRQASETFERVLADDPYDASSAIALAQVRINWAYVLLKEKSYSEALSGADRNLPLLEPLHRSEPQSATIRRALMNTHGIRATILEAQGRRLECAKAYERCVEFADDTRRRSSRCELASLWAQAGDHRKAAALVAEILSEHAALTPAQFQHLVRAMARSILAAERDAALTVEVREKLAGEYADLAVTSIRRARRDVPDAWPEQWKMLEAESELRPLLVRADIQEAMRD